MSDAIEMFRAAIAAAGLEPPDVIEPGRLHRFSTNGKRGDTSGWCQFFADGRAGVFGCWRSGLSSVWTARQHEPMTLAERADMARRVKAAAAARESAKQAGWGEAADRLAALWAQCREVPADGTGTDPMTLYLHRRLALAPGEAISVPDVLRLHPSLPYHHEGAIVGRWPAMVAAIQGPDGATVALHRTWLTPEGHKAPAPGPRKKLTPTAGSLVGACIRLSWPGAGATDLLGVAEGVETALAARRLTGVPTVAACSAWALAAWQWPPGLRRLVVFVDADRAGIEAGDQLQQRAQATGLAVEAMRPSKAGDDWADVLVGRAAGVQP